MNLMLPIESLTGVPSEKRGKVVQCLDELLTFKDDQQRISPVISGYNFYQSIPLINRVITFSHIHETEVHKQDMLRDLEQLGYHRQTILKQLRNKGGAFLWDPEYRIRDDMGGILVGLKIKDVRTGQYINLSGHTKPLVEYSQYANSKGHLIAEDHGWELDMPFNTKAELMNLVDLFLRKCGQFIYGQDGIRIQETAEERAKRAPWSDAYRVPVVILGQTALEYAADLQHFDRATRVHLVENDNEISFIIHKRLEFLKTLAQYEQLKQLGFQEEACLGNKPFLKMVDNQ